jgi:hypothetical protein
MAIMGGSICPVEVLQETGQKLKINKVLVNYFNWKKHVLFHLFNII